jgi:aryl-alcohol dehydrogenase-like predicted oxidoreductase
MSESSLNAVSEYQKIANKHGLTLTQLSLAFVNQLPFVTSNIIGATNLTQLKENIGLLVYSPLAFGVLSGKYIGGKTPKGARVSLFPRFNRYSSEQSEVAVMKYQDIAKKHGLTLAQMSLAFVNQLPFVTSNIIGATTLPQLKENMASVNINLSDTILKEIEAVHSLIPNPAP